MTNKKLIIVRVLSLVLGLLFGALMAGLYHYVFGVWPCDVHDLGCLDVSPKNGGWHNE